MPFATPWMGLEIIILSEVKSNRGEISSDIPYMQNLKRNDTNELINKTETDSRTSRMNLWLPRGKGDGKGQLGKLGSIYTHCYVDSGYQQGPSVSDRELCSMLCGSLDGRGV